MISLGTSECAAPYRKQGDVGHLVGPLKLSS